MKGYLPHSRKTDIDEVKKRHDTLSSISAQIMMEYVCGPRKSPSNVFFIAIDKIVEEIEYWRIPSKTSRLIFKEIDLAKKYNKGILTEKVIEVAKTAIPKTSDKEMWRLVGANHNQLEYLVDLEHNHDTIHVIDPNKGIDYVKIGICKAPEEFENEIKKYLSDSLKIAQPIEETSRTTNQIGLGTSAEFNLTMPKSERKEMSREDIFKLISNFKSYNSEPAEFYDAKRRLNLINKFNSSNGMYNAFGSSDKLFLSKFSSMNDQEKFDEIINLKMVAKLSN